MGELSWPPQNLFLDIHTQFLLAYLRGKIQSIVHGEQITHGCASFGKPLFLFASKLSPPSKQLLLTPPMGIFILMDT